MNVRLERLLKKRLSGNLTAEEELELLSLIGDKDNDEQLSAFLEATFDTENPAETSLIMTDEQADRIFDSIIARDPVSRPKTKQRLAWLAAASVLLIFSVLLLTKNPFTISGSKSQSVALVTVSTKSSHQLIRLPDGSTVVLNNNSTLVYPEKFTGNTREVKLTGEGYFDIRHSKEQTFIVHTGKIRTTVLGTAFNIRAYRSDPKVNVTVTRGRVRVSTEHQMLADLRPDQQVTYRKDLARAETVKTKALEAIEWQSRDLFFDDVTMKEAALLLEQRFRTKIRFADQEAESCRFSGTFLKGEDLDEVLTVICSFNNCSYHTDQHGNKIINGVKCQASN